MNHHAHTVWLLIHGYARAPGAEAYDKVFTVTCKTNRLLLFREAVWHQVPSLFSFRLLHSLTNIVQF